eukprot:5759645-Amphidinium_carterae.1
MEKYSYLSDTEIAFDTNVHDQAIAEICHRPFLFLSQELSDSSFGPWVGDSFDATSTHVSTESCG